jgi:hypothetical protein
VKLKMKADGVPQVEIDAYFIISGPVDPFESSSTVKVFMMRPDTPLAALRAGLFSSRRNAGYGRKRTPCG